MKKLHDWQRRLANTIATAQEVPFAWGTFDCALAACRLIHAQTGVDPGLAYRGKYSTEAEAIAVIGGAGDLGTFAAGIAASFGMAEIKPTTFATRGDLVLVNNTVAAAVSSTALGIVGLDPRYAHCVSEHGMVRVGMHRWLRAWKVG